jgi:hypothetical protein
LNSQTRSSLTHETMVATSQVAKALT